MFLFSSPRILKKILNKKFSLKEYLWLKNVISNIKINKIIYLSSSSVYYKNKHIIGNVKKKCERYILKNKNKFVNYQIWRPFNLIPSNYIDNDHFHNFLFKKMFKQKKLCTLLLVINLIKRIFFCDDFSKLLLSFSKKNESFIKDYGNKNLVTIQEIINLFNKYYFKKNKKFL